MGDGGQDKDSGTSGALFYYLLLATGLAFWTRAMPTPFLPLVMAEEFHQSSTQIGLVMSATPLGAFIATPLASTLAQRSRHIVYFHSVSLLFISLTSFLMAFLQQAMATGAVFVVVTMICFAQGVGQALYMAANTTLISRRFTAVAYVVGMAEVAVGLGAQLGRLGGGGLYDLGGFGCPFLTASLALAICGIIGFTFDDGSGDVASHAKNMDRSDGKRLSWNILCSSGILLATSGVFAAYMMTGLVDVTLPQHLESYLGPLPITVISAVSSLRSLTYLLTSWLCAQAMHQERALEPFQCFGFAFTIVGLITLDPLQWVVDAETIVLHQPPSRFVEWVCQIFSLVVASIGNAFLFIPGLPLMHSHVRHLGPSAAEQVSLLLMMAMFGGECIGPIAGGALVERFGFHTTTAAFALTLMPLFALTALNIVRDSGMASPSETLQADLLTRTLSPTEESQELAENSSMPVDPESAYRFRRLAFCPSTP